MNKTRPEWVKERMPQRKKTELSGSKRVGRPLPLILGAIHLPNLQSGAEGHDRKGPKQFELSFLLLPQHRIQGYNLVPARVRGQEQMLSGRLARQFPIRLCFSSFRPPAPNPYTPAQLLPGSINPLVPRAVNGMLIGLMGFMSTSPNELLLTSLAIFSLSLCLSTQWSLCSSLRASWHCLWGARAKKAWRGAPLSCEETFVPTFGAPIPHYLIWLRSLQNGTLEPFDDRISDTNYFLLDILWS